MLTSRNRLEFRLHRLADYFGYASIKHIFRAKIYENLRTCLRLTTVFTIILLFMTMATICAGIIWHKPTQRIVTMKLLTRICRAVIHMIGIKIDFSFSGSVPKSGREGYLIVPNHISYLDVIVISSLMPTLFVTSRDIEKTPVLGAICRSGGCLFVERHNRKDLLNDISMLSATLNQGFNVVLFLEGSTSDGMDLLEFKRSLLESVMKTRCKILPLCLRYTEINGVQFDNTNKDHVAWYGAMTFFPHIKKLMSLRSINVKVSQFSPIKFRQHKSRRTLAEDIRKTLHSHFFS